MDVFFVRIASCVSFADELHDLFIRRLYVPLHLPSGRAGVGSRPSVSLPGGMEGQSYRLHGEFGVDDTATSVLLPGFAVAVREVFAAARNSG